MDTVSVLSILLPMTLGVFYSRKDEAKWFWYYLMLVAITEGIMWYYAAMGMRNVHIYNAYVVIQIGVLSYILLLQLRSFIRPVIRRLVSIALSLTTLTVVHTHGWNQFSYGTYILPQLVLASLSGTALVYLIIQDDTRGELFRKPMFWINFGLVFYLSITTVILTSLDLGLIRHRADYFWIYSTFHPWVNITTNVIYGYAFICNSSRIPFFR